LCGICFPTPESLLHVSRHPCQYMCAINGTNIVLKSTGGGHREIIIIKIKIG
jgi:hypothetical protein